MPTENNKRRSVFVDDKLWAASKKKAKADDRTHAAWIRAAIKEKMEKTS